VVERARLDHLELLRRGIDLRHLPGKHDQSSHGRKGPAGAAKSAAKKAVKSLAERIADAVTGSDAVRAAPYVMHEGHDRGGFDTDQIDGALTHYVQGGYMGMNEDARKGVFDDPRTGEAIRHVDAAMGPLDRDVQVWRGIRRPEKVFGGAWNDTDVTGLEWRDDGYSSTSGSEHTSAGYFSGNGGVVMRIFAPKGSKAVGISATGGETELLLARGSKFRVVADHGILDGRRRLDVEVLG
jgi:hypothetical protein